MLNPCAINANLGGTGPTLSNWSATPIRDLLYTGVGFTVELSGFRHRTDGANREKIRMPSSASLFCSPNPPMMEGCWLCEQVGENLSGLFSS